MLSRTWATLSTAFNPSVPDNNNEGRPRPGEPPHPSLPPWHLPSSILGALQPSFPHLIDLQLNNDWAAPSRGFYSWHLSVWSNPTASFSRTVSSRRGLWRLRLRSVSLAIQPLGGLPSSSDSPRHITNEIIWGNFPPPGNYNCSTETLDGVSAIIGCSLGGKGRRGASIVGIYLGSYKSKYN